ncbi:hypothetical protein [Rhodohalobacter halophilus]|uniref:hypothetical protein n=1 Tax=Rhodohalobacter halophilus TaxID=1812810 RepID=UPI00083F8614|nr:hypothetical protein [Rhodohalobacter halophilus]
MDFTSLAVLLFSSAILLFSCASNGTEKTIEEIAKDIDKLIGDGAADSVEQCAIMPIGVKPAGGPWGFLIYSTKKTDREKLESLVNRYNELDAARNEEGDTFSSADVATEPALKLVDGHCFGEGRYAWNPGEVQENT